MDEVYDLLVVGAGIAGCEAAWRASGKGARVLLVTMSLDQINLPTYLPALFLRHDEAKSLQKRLEGTLFGEAFRRSAMGSYETPCLEEIAVVFDRREFSLVSKDILEKRKGLDTRQALIKSMQIDETIAIESIFGEVFKGERVVFSPGSYVKGRIRIGRLKLKSGRYGDLAADGLAESLKDAGVETMGWAGTIPEVVDMRRMAENDWKEAGKSRHSSIKSAEGKLRSATEKPMRWKEEEGSTLLLVPLSPRSEEAFLVRRPPGPSVSGKGTGEAAVRMRVVQECLVMKERGGKLPPTVDFTGSFNGEKGYLDCMEDGTARAEEILRK